MNGVYQFIRILKLQIPSSMFNDGFVPGFFILLALTMLLLMLFPAAKIYLDTDKVMTAVYSLLVIGVLWKFIRYMREKM